MPKQKNWQLAYADYKAGTTYADIAAKYGVTVAAVNSWRTRHWSELGNADSADNADNNAGTMQESMQALPIKLDVSKGRAVFAPIVEKQIADTQADVVFAGYNKDNLPPLERKQAVFVQEYLVDLNATQAAIRAGYEISNAHHTSCMMMQRKDIQAHVAAALAERSRRTGINQDIIYRELARISLANPARVVAKDGSIMEDASEDDLAAVQAVKVKVTPTRSGEPIIEREIRFHDKNRALELLMKASGMLIERKKVDVTQHVEEMTDDERRQRIAELQSKLAIDVESVRE